MATKATPSYTDQLADAHAIELTKVEASRAAYQEARALVPQMEAKYEAADERLEEVVSSIQSLSDEYTPHDLSLAEAAVTCARLRYKGAENKLKAAERNVISSDTSVATAIADAIRPHMPDVTVCVTFLRRDIPIPANAELPVLLVVQAQAAERNRYGNVAGPAILRYYRARNHRPLDKDVIEGGLAKAGANVRCDTVTPNGPDTLDTMNVQVKSIAPTVPLIAHIDPLQIQAMVNGVIADLVKPSLERGKAISQDGRVLYSQKIKATADNVKVVNEELEGDSRTLTVDASIVYELTGQVSYSNSAVIERAVSDLVGRFIGGAGRIVAAEVVNADSELWHGGDRHAILRHLKLKSLNANPVEVGGVGYEVFDQAVIRVTLESFTA